MTSLLVKLIIFFFFGLKQIFSDILSNYFFENYHKDYLNETLYFATFNFKKNSYLGDSFLDF